MAKLKPVQAGALPTRTPGKVAAYPSSANADGPAAISDEAYRSVGAFRRLVREFLAFSSEGASEQGITAQQHQALLAVRAHEGDEPMSIGQLADSLLIQNHSAVGLVGRLVERELLVRSPSAADRRRVHLALTGQGERVLEAVTRRNLARLGQAADVLSDLVGTLQKLPKAD